MRPRPRPRPAWFAARARVCALCAALAAAGLGCGRRATPQDCDVIVDRYVEVELAALKVTDPKVIELRKAEMRRDLKDDLKACPGKRITDAMMSCVHDAQTNADLDRCTRW